MGLKNLTNYSIPGAVILSDLHLETGRKIQDCISPSKHTPIIVPGDITRVELTDLYTDAVKWLSENFLSVVIVPGNHEYISTTMNMTQIDDILDSFQHEYDNVIILRNQFVMISGMVVYGGVLWSYATDKGFKQPYIYNERGLRLTIDDWNEMYFDHVKMINKAISYARKRYHNCLIITHYAPTYKDTINPKYDGSPYNCMYASDLDTMIKNDNVYRWVYGHTGYNKECTVKTITNQCNKSGYRKNYQLL